MRDGGSDVAMEVAIGAEGGGAPTDATIDQAVDATIDAGVDAAGDATVNTSGDSTVDATPDATNDLGSAELDAALDAASDGGDADAYQCTYRALPPASASVLQFHKNPSRDGVYVDPAFTQSAVYGMQARFAVPLDGASYAQALYVVDVQNDRELFVAATETNHLTVVDGCGKAVWDKTYGAPVQAADLPCGNTFPLGITGTPVIDAASRTIYFDAMTQTASGQTGLRHRLHAVSLDDGSEKSGWPIDVQASVPGFDSSHQNQRSALTLLNGVLYVPYGGLYGDCGQYYGWVVGVLVSTPSAVTSWRTIAGAPWDGGPPVTGGGFWAAGGLSTDGTSLFAVSGNTMDPTDASQWNAPPNWAGGETVFRLAAGPSFSGASADYFLPSNWQLLDQADQDLGSVGAVPFDVGSAHYLVTMDKLGEVYVLDRDDLGASPIASASLVPPCGQDACDLVGAPVVYTASDGTHIVFPVPAANSDAVLVLSGDPPVLSAPNFEMASLGAPIATTTDGGADFFLWSSTIWDLSNFSSSTSLQTPPIAANGRIVATTCGSCGGDLGLVSGSLVFYY
ncbi:MAG: hypothetical protein ACRENE_29190 [Polyangiaceae bacterium]